ncbi:MAG: hypothetical protein DMF81_21915 [Acidobacteria bacterium]|nr:MAG: hypothetical protein DMF81_21915 [Acidobacteriota bacterium]
MRARPPSSRASICWGGTPIPSSSCARPASPGSTRVCGCRRGREDLVSLNGTFVRGERLKGPARLEDGDEFTLGSVRLTFRVLRAPDFSETA